MERNKKLPEKGTFEMEALVGFPSCPCIFAIKGNVYPEKLK